MIKKIEVEIEIPDFTKFGLNWNKLWKDFNKLHKDLGKIPDWKTQKKQIERLVNTQLENLNEK